MSKTVLIVGDSHAEYFQPSERLKFHKQAHLKDIEYRFILKRGATIRGFGRRKGSLKLGSEVEEELNRLKNCSNLILALGQVDIELGLYYKQVIKGESTDNFIDEIIESYCLTLREMKARYPNLVIAVKGINPTVFLYRPFTVRYISRIINENIRDENEKNIYKKKLDLELPTFYIRHRQHMEFNKKLEKMAIANGLEYFDLWNYVIDSNTGVVADRFVPFKFDHHLADTLETRLVHQQALFKHMISIV